MEGSARTLVVVPCGRRKVWDREPGRGAVAAKDAYAGAPFRLNRAYAERFGDAWVVLSAKHGFVAPDFLVPGPYDATFARPSTGPVPAATLRAQVVAQGLDRFPRVVGLGGKDYRAALAAAFAGRPVRLVFPFAGLPIGRAMRAAKRAVAEGRSGFAPEDGSGAGGR